MKIDIFLFWFMNDWGLYGRAYEKIAENLAKMPEVKRVICSFPPVKVPPVVPIFQIIEHSEKMLILNQKEGIMKPNGRPYRYRQIVNQNVLKISLKYIIKRLGLKRDSTMLWLYPPHAYIDNIIVDVPHNFIVTQIVDNNSLMEGLCESYTSDVACQYKKLAELSNVTITSSQINYDLYSMLSTNCAMFENAVDSAFISDPSSLPCRINPQKRPTLGYLGFISERTNITLLEFIAKSRPNYDLYIAGPIVSPLNLTENGLLGLPNVYYLGTLPYNEVPVFLKGVDVCLIPHKNTLYSKSMSPLKLFQYLGSGRPIISTSITGVERFRNIISIADNNEEFLKMIDINIENDNIEFSRKRIEVAQREVWEVRVKEIFNYTYNKYLIELQKMRL